MALFSDIERNIRMLEGAYRKLKTHCYYNKNFILLRRKIARFESDPENMDATFVRLAKLLKNTKSAVADDYLEQLLAQIDFYCFPKKFESIEQQPNEVVTNATPKDKKLKSVNFFINMPIELHILDVLWSLFIGKIINDKQLLSENLYGNTIVNTIFSNDDDIEEAINFKNNRLLNIYFYKYSQWRNRAFESLDDCYSRRHHSYLFSLDIRSYFYTVQFDFRDLNKAIKKHPLQKDIEGLTEVIESIYSRYYNNIKPYRQDIVNAGVGTYPLPIGTISSMILGNLYLRQFDDKVKKTEGVIYFGRYVDDILIVIDADDGLSEVQNANPIKKYLVEAGLLEYREDGYTISSYPNLVIQEEKIKALHIDPNESRAILDTYEKTVKIIPSQMAVLPDYDVEIADFDESTLVIQNLTRDKKVRDIGKTEIDPFKVSRFFATLVHKRKNVYEFSESYRNKIEEQIDKIMHFFVGSQSIEYYSVWQNYLYFLVLCGRHEKQISTFISRMKSSINKLTANSIDRTIFRKRNTIIKKVREALNEHLEIVVSSALALDIPVMGKRLHSYFELSNLIYKANMFEHALVAIPLANYLEYEVPISFIHMNICDLGNALDFTRSSKMKWSPRFVHYEEILLLLFYMQIKTGQPKNVTNFAGSESVQRFIDINSIRSECFQIESHFDPYPGYELEVIKIPFTKDLLTDKLRVAVANVIIDPGVCLKTISDYRKGMSVRLKETLRKVLKEANDSKANLLVLPELYLPVLWLNELLDFSRKSQIAIITGIQYISNPNKTVKNEIAVILPFRTGTEYKYKNAFIYIREKNDYSPIEYEELAKLGFSYTNRKTPQYQIFSWNNVDIVPFLCYEFTDIMARAIVRGKCELIVVCELNKDTTYFSDIIYSAVRDLHTVIIQANTSNYGDSRITCPYDRDSRDILKIKGGENEYVFISTIKLRTLLEYQAEYYNKQKIIEGLAKRKRAKRKHYSDCENCVYKKKKPEIKKPSARFSNAHAIRKIHTIRIQKIFNMGCTD